MVKKWVNFENIYHFTALMYAVVKHSSSHIIKILVENGADINRHNSSNGASLFHLAAEADNAFAIVYLH